MPSLSDGGIRIFSASSAPALEDSINQFLVGTGTIEDTRKTITQAPVFTIEAGVFYAMLVYRTVT